ncbi:MAG: response regulator [Thermoleophilia bacterium]
MEDEAAVRDLTVRALTREGYLVLATDSARQALSLTGAHPGDIDVVLTDVVLPSMGDRGLADALHANRAGLRILFMSGYTRDAIVHDGRLDPGIAFLEKPFTPQALTAKVRSMLAAGAVY